MIDCGNVLNQPLLKNMLAAFAALFRMQRAENILLLRVSRYLRINVSRGSDLFRLMIWNMLMIRINKIIWVSRVKRCRYPDIAMYVGGAVSFVFCCNFGVNSGSFGRQILIILRYQKPWARCCGTRCKNWPKMRDENAKKLLRLGAFSEQKWVWAWVLKFSVFQRPSWSLQKSI